VRDEYFLVVFQVPIGGRNELGEGSSVVVLYLRSVGGMFNQMVFQWTFLTLSIGELMGNEI
jgi:hypothetical protein